MNGLRAGARTRTRCVLLLHACTLTLAGAMRGAAAAAAIDASADGVMTLDAVRVEADAVGSALRRNASSATIVIDRAALDAMDAATVGDLLRRLPATGLAADEGDRRGRGRRSDHYAPRILVDGEAMPGEGRDGGAALRLPADLIERIEIIRNSSAEHPSGGAGGTINIVLRDAPRESSTSWRAAGGSQQGETVLRASAQHGDRAGDTGFLLAASIDSTPVTGHRDRVIERYAAGTRSDYRVERGEDSGRRNSVTLSPRLNRDLGERWQWVLSPLFSYADDERDTRTSRRDYADPVALTGSQAAAGEDESDRSRKIALRLMSELKSRRGAGAESSLRLLLQAERAERDQLRRETDATGASTSLRTVDDVSDEQEGGLVGRTKAVVGEAHILSAGGELRGKWGDERRSQSDQVAPGASDGRTAERRRDRRVVVWLQDEWQFAERQLLTAGLRTTRQISRLDDGSAPVARDDTAVEPSLHYLWQPSARWNLRASAAHSERAPGLRDLSALVRTASGVNSAANPDRGGNPSLRPERTLALEIGVEHFLPQRGGTVGLSVFRRVVDDQVLRVAGVEAGRWTERPFNVGDAVLRGAVFDLNVGPDAWGMSGLTVRGNLAYAHTDYDGAVLRDEAPRRSWHFGIDRLWAASGISAGLQYGSTARIERREGNGLELLQRARRQLDVYVQRKLDHRVSVRLSALNLTREGRDSVARELDAGGLPARIESDAESGAAIVLVSLEGRW